MVSVPHPSRRGPRLLWERLAATARLMWPAEGFTIILLHLLVVLAASWAILRADWTEGLVTLPLISVVGALVGLLLAKAEAPDLASHLTAFWLGLAMVVLNTASAFPELGPTWHARLQELALRFEHWTEATAGGEQSNDDYLFAILMGLTMWLVAYMSAWTLYRRQWLTSALVLPGFVILINIGYQPETGAPPLVLFLLAGGTLIAAHFAYRRRVEWRNRGMPAPQTLRWSFLGLGFNAVLALTVLAWLLPVGARHEAFDRVWEAMAGPWEQVQERWEEMLDGIEPSGRDRSQTYAQFDDEFDLGGAIDLSDDPMLQLVQDGGQAPYLAARRYDYWDGFGWRSNIESTFDPTGPNGERYAPRVTFADGQPVDLSDSVTTSRVEQTSEIRVIAAVADGLIFTRDTYVSSDMETSVQLSWRQLDNVRFSIVGPDRAALPAVLQRIGNLLSEARFATDAAGNYVVTDLAVRRLIEQAQNDLKAVLLDVTWEIEGDRAVALIVNGQLPVYDDVEAVYARQPPRPGETYEVTGLVSTASSDELRGAGMDYPDYVVERYLQLPTTVTPRTRELAATIAATAESDAPFDIAVAIQNDLRQRIRYNENISDPPQDQDVVDYVLFESQEGYCEYYASSMVVMLRTLGIPARVVSGFFPPSYDPAADGFIYRERNAHLWVEVYFPGYGWVPFEPTASQSPFDYGTESPERTPTPTPTPEIPTPTPESAEPEATQAAFTEPTPTPTQPAASATQNTPQDPAGFLDDRGNRWLLAIASVLLLVAVVALGVAFAWRRGLGGLSPVAGFYARALKLGRWLGIRANPTMTPAEYADYLGKTIPAARGPVQAVTNLYVAEQYAEQRESPQVVSTGETAWKELRRSLLRAWPGLKNPFRRRGPADEDSMRSDR